MSETKHTTTPWLVGFVEGESALENSWSIYAPDTSEHAKEGDLIAVATHLTEQHARRIAACVNACAGIETEALEAGAVGDLLVTLKEAVFALDAICLKLKDAKTDAERIAVTEVRRRIDAANDAIAKATGR